MFSIEFLYINNNKFMVVNKIINNNIYYIVLKLGDFIIYCWEKMCFCIVTFLVYGITILLI